MFRRVKSLRPLDRAARRCPSCADRLLYRALFLALAAVILLSLAIGVTRLREAGRSVPVSESFPVAGAEQIQLVDEPPDHA